LAYFTGVFFPKFIETNLQAEMASKAARIFVTHFSNFVQSLFNWRIRMQAFVLQEGLI
jgi:hypothetical protein